MKDLRSKVRAAVLRYPTLLPKYIVTLKKCNNLAGVAMVHKECNKLLPYRFAFEFEAMGCSFIQSYYNKGYFKHLRNTCRINTKLDTCADNKKDQKYQTTYNNEERIDLYRKPHLNLVALFTYLQYAKKHRQIHKDQKGSTHINIDGSAFFNTTETYLWRCNFVTWLQSCGENQFLKDVEKITGEKYTGEYNQRQISDSKLSWVRLHVDRFEFRIFPFTTDYITLISWVVQLEALLKAYYRAYLTKATSVTKP
jgi:hypothetical protein